MALGGMPQGQPSGDEGLISFRTTGSNPPAMVMNEDGLLVENPMHKAFKQRREAGEEANRQARDAETDEMMDQFSKARRQKETAWDQELSERSAQSAANFEADMQARGSQRTTPRTPGRGGFLRLGRSGRGPGR